MAQEPSSNLGFVLKEQYENLCSLEMMNNALLARFDIDDGESVSHDQIDAYFKDCERHLTKLFECEKTVKTAIQRAESQCTGQGNADKMRTLMNIRNKAISIRKTLDLLVEKISRRRNGLSKKTLQISKNNQKIRLYAQNM
ncbi:hypothetical protein A2V82_02400 [candidate division KSB1 bacterium RBG_16_48_16]|nr:MAG: hypothetical protein A2V82_02400 [candidate division KSB1 bacterium RBG_16_48_16]